MQKLRRQQLACICLAVFIETNYFEPEERQNSGSRSIRLPVASAETGRLIAAATKVLALRFKPGFRYLKAAWPFWNLCRRRAGRLVPPAARCEIQKQNEGA